MEENGEKNDDGRRWTGLAGGWVELLSDDDLE